MQYQLSEDDKKKSPEDQKIILAAMNSFFKDVLQADPSKAADPMPTGKADFAPLGVDTSGGPVATEDRI